MGFVVTVILSLPDLWKRTTRRRGFLALLLCLPVLLFFLQLVQWEGPLYMSVLAEEPIEFRIDGAAGFYGLALYGPEHQKAEWRGDDIGVVWSFNWNRYGKFPLMKARVEYGVLPPGYVQTSPAGNTPPPPLDPEATYTLVLDPAMGMTQYRILHGHLISETRTEFGSNVCWGPLNVPGRSDPAYVRVDCNTHAPLPMSKRAQDRLKAYQEKRLAFY